MSDERAVLGIVLTHGSMAVGMVDAVQRIAGTEPEALRAVSNEGRAPQALVDEVEEIIGDRTAIVFTDLQTGSCALVARLVCREKGGRAVIFGANLAMLLDFVFHRTMPLDELVPRLLEKGKGAVTGVTESPSHADPAVSS